MEATSTRPRQVTDLSERALLDELRIHRQVIAAAEVDELSLAYEWAVSHPAHGDSSVLSADEQPGGAGTPGVAAFTAEPLAVALGVSPAAAQALLADTLDLHHRLPRLLDQVRDLRLPVWRARRIAKATRALSEAAAHWVDRQLVGCAASVGVAQLDRLVATAVARVDPDGQAAREAEARKSWDVTLTRPREWAGTSTLTAVGDTADLTGLHALVDSEADALAAVDDSSKGARRVKALASLVRHGAQAALDLMSPDARPASPRPPRSVAPALRLYLHASLRDLPHGTPGAVGTVERLGPLALSRIREWVSHSRVTVVPALDLADNPWTPRHDPPPRTAERVVLRDGAHGAGGCVFPACGRDARSADLDHVIPWPRGSTRPSNLASC